MCNTRLWLYEKPYKAREGLQNVWQQATLLREALRITTRSKLPSLPCSPNKHSPSSTSTATRNRGSAPPPTPTLLTRPIVSSAGMGEALRASADARSSDPGRCGCGSRCPGWGADGL